MNKIAVLDRLVPLHALVSQDKMEFFALEPLPGHNLYRQAALLHFGQEPVTQNPATWSTTYNRRRMIKAANKEGKQVFEICHLKVRSRPA